MLNADEIRSKHSTFNVRLRGYDPAEVRTYLARFALVADAISEGLHDAPALPTDFNPVNVRTIEFTEIWRGLDRKQVHAYLDQLSQDLDARLTTPPPS